VLGCDRLPATNDDRKYGQAASRPLVLPERRKLRGGVGLQIIRDWVLRFNARGPDGLLDGKPPGQPSKLNDAQRSRSPG
jgi:hypothetical protein